MMGNGEKVGVVGEKGARAGERAHSRAQICERNAGEKERGGRGPSRWQGTVATETRRGENNEGLEWCFMSHPDMSVRPEPPSEQY